MNAGKILTVLTSLTVSYSFSVSAYAMTSDESKLNKTNVHVGVLYLQPNSNNLKYAVFVSGNQPYHQSWHNQTIQPGYSPGLELGFNYALPATRYGISVDWLYVSTSDSSSKQATQNTNVTTVEFVAPPYDVGPAVFGIKRASSTLKNNFNSIGINFGRVFESEYNVTGKVFGGINVVSINQNITTTFSDYAGSPILPGQAYALPADPDFYFRTNNSSDYLGAGPNIGLNVQYENKSGFGLVGQFSGSLTVGSVSAQDNFTSSSKRLMDLGISPTSQNITTSNVSQLVPGLDSKLGVLYHHASTNMDLTIEGGYRYTYYFNAISTVAPDTLVQAGIDPTIPEFATGTMAINSTTSTTSPFSLRGPYLNLTLGFS